MINIEEHRKYVYSLLERANIPLQYKDDTYQDFCVYYYSQTTEYNPEYAVTTWLSMKFKGFLSDTARRWNIRKRQGALVSMDNAEEMWDDVDLETNIDMDRLYRKLPALFKTLLNTNKTVSIIAQEEGVSRQAIERKLKLLMQVATKDYTEDYA
jgi:DNA-directed RNA polymerase specialized sigma24 family protein